MTKTKRVAAMMMAAAMGTSIIGVIPAAAEEERETLKLALTQSSMVTDYENNYFTKYLEDKLNINIEFYMLPADSAEARTKVNLMATSNEDLPDVMITDNFLTNEMILQLGDSGFFTPLNDYLNDPEIMPNFNAIPDDDREAILKATTQADGNIYGFAAYEPETWNLTPNRMFINRAWLDKLGLEVPTTTDELKTVLEAFRDGDPNGNGVQDEIGVYGFAGGGYGENTVDALMNAFIFWNGGLSLSDDGTEVIAPFTQDAWREGLTYLNELSSEGLLSANIFTDDGQQFKAILNQETPIVGLTTAGSLSNWPDVKNNKNFAEMEMIERFGEEGVDWTRDPKDLEGQTNAYVEAGLYDKLSMLVISTIWSDNQSQTWRNHGPRYASLEMGNTVYDYSSGNKFDVNDPTQLNAKCYELYYPKHPEYVLPTLKYTLDETELIQEQLTTLPTFVDQCMAEFITGARSLDDAGWNAYLDELETMGLSTWLETAQVAYDRTK